MEIQTGCDKEIVMQSTSDYMVPFQLSDLALAINIRDIHFEC